jgi:hypothetical protein
MPQVSERDQKNTKTLVNGITEAPMDAKDRDHCTLLHGASKMREWLKFVLLEMHRL